MGSDGADAFADKVENDKKAGIHFDPARGLVPLRVWAREWLERRVIAPCAVDEDEIPTLSEVDLIAEHIAAQYRHTVYLQSGAGQRPSEALAFSAECRRPGFVRIRWQVSAKAHRDGCRTVLAPLKHRTEGEYRDAPAAPFVEQEIDDHLSLDGCINCAGQKGSDSDESDPFRLPVLT
ncbi:hypothetical protein [Streptomyces tendae]|uniref:hypothetical protein n=1 Tax=Streptomyces tendae TaxID=1932 RepID=UPI003716A156